MGGKLYPEVEAGEDGWTEWVQPVMEGYKFQCCDCGLVHVLEFAIEDRRVLFRVKRDNRATGQARRHRGITGRH